MWKYKKWRYTIQYVKPTAQLIFKNRFPKGGPTCRRQVVNPRHQASQGQTVAKPGTPLLGADQATSHYLNQWWLDYRRIYASLGLNELCLKCLIQLRSETNGWVPSKLHKISVRMLGKKEASAQCKAQLLGCTDIGASMDITGQLLNEAKILLAKGFKKTYGSAVYFCIVTKCDNADCCSFGGLHWYGPTYLVGNYEILV